MSPRTRAVAAAVAALLLAAGGGLAAWRLGAGGGVAADDPAAPAAPRTTRVRLVADGPRRARVHVNDRDVGWLELDAQENVSGDAILRLPLLARGMVTHEVPIERGPGVERALALYTQRVLAVMGVLRARLVEPAAPGPAPPG